MVLFLQCIIILAVYTTGIVIKAKNPMRFYSDYPVKIKERIASLPEYKYKIPTSQKTYGIKIFAAIILCAVLAEMCYLASATTFIKAFIHVFILTLAVNLFDLIILDLIWFCHSKHFRLPGTEDMIKEYKSITTHVKGFVSGLCICLVVSAIVGIIIQII